MACDRKTLMLVSCYADGEALGEEAARAAAHLETCPECRKLVDEWQGSRQLLEWACNSELSEEVDMERVVTAAPRETARRLSVPRLQWNWMMASGVALAVVVGLVSFWFATLPPVLNVGEKVAPGRVAQNVRIGSRIRLEVGPGSRLERLDERTVRLEQGWVYASVAHGTGFRIVTKRMQVFDKGTRFMVGTKPELDCVTVDEGRVSVISDGRQYDLDSGRVFMAAAGHISMGALRQKQPDEDEEGSLLSARSASSRPQDADEMALQEGLRALARRFPEARIASGSVGGANETNGRRYRYNLTSSTGLLKGLREHFSEIARAAAGETIYGDWEIPVCYLLTDEIEQPQALPAGVYYIRLVASGGSVYWRLSDGAGHDADMPLAWTLHRPNHNGGESRDSTGSTCHEEDVKDGRLDLAIRLLDWPGDIKPTLQLKTKGVLLSEYTKPDQPLLSQVEKLASSIQGFGGCSPDVDYLDAQRRHRLAVQWNDNAGRELCRLCDGLKRGQGGEAILGVVATDSSFDEPELPGGAYLLRLVMPGPDQPARLELARADSPDARGFPLPREGVEAKAAGNCWGPYVPRGYSWVQFHYACERTEGRDLVYSFWILGRPDRPVVPNVPVWVQGAIRVRKP